MKIQWLGTAAAEGWPAVFCKCSACQKARELGGKDIRTRSGALIDDELLIDVSPDLYANKLRFDLDLSRVRTILITHCHGDHFLPVYFECLNQASLGSIERDKIELYGPYDVTDQLDGYKDRLDVHTVEAGDRFTTATGHTILTLPAIHSAVNGKFYYIEKDGRSLLYAHDTGVFTEEAVALLRAYVIKPIDVVSLDCTYGLNPHEKKGHMNMEDDAVVKKRLENELLADSHTCFVCNHFSHNSHLTHEEMIKAAGRFGMNVSYDGMIKEI